MTLKRFDLFSMLAVLGILLILLFEGVFIADLYQAEYSKLEPFLPEALKPIFAPGDPMDESPPVFPKEEPVPVEPKDIAPVG